MKKTKQIFSNNKKNSVQHILSCEMETDDFLIKLGEHIKSLRQAKNITVKELARRTGKTQATIIRLEKGKDNIKILTLKIKFQKKKFLLKHYLKSFQMTSIILNTK